MKLLTKELRKEIPPLYTQQDDPDPIARCKFFLPDGGWTWYVIEGSALVGNMEVPLSESNPEVEDDVIFFGLVYGLEKELGTFSLRELESVHGFLGLGVERDLYFEPKPLSEVEREHR